MKLKELGIITMIGILIIIGVEELEEETRKTKEKRKNTDYSGHRAASRVSKENCSYKKFSENHKQQLL